MSHRMAANMYRVGDYVFFETSSTTPYQIRRIEELNKTPSGNVEAKVMCFYRRRDISSNLIGLADKHQCALEEDTEGRCKEDLTETQRHQMKHRELFLSRQVETLPATHIRGKCAVTLLNETEALLSYLNKDDAFFYSLVYDPQQKTLLADKGEIRVGQKYQADVILALKEGKNEIRESKNLEELMWSPDNCTTDKQIDQFMVIARSVGTFARALDCTSTVRQPSLHMSAAAASRDITLFQAMDTLHQHLYDISRAIASLVPTSGPVLCRDEMEEWSASEANLFEEALDKYGKDFNDIRQDFLPWKSLKSIVEYYYMWKTTDRYVQQKRIKAAEAECKLKQVYIPDYNKPNPAQITDVPGRACESCYQTQSNQWYAWGPGHMQCRLCAACWIYWKKYGGLKMATRLGQDMEDGERPAPNQRQDRLAQMQAIRMHRCTITDCAKEFRLKSHLARHLATTHGLAMPPPLATSPTPQSSSSQHQPVMKTRAAFCLVTTRLTRVSRQLCADVLRVRQAARQPFAPINAALIKQECQIQLPDGTKLRPLAPRKRATLLVVSSRLGIGLDMPMPDLLRRTEVVHRDPATYMFPRGTQPAQPLPPKVCNNNGETAPTAVTTTTPSATPTLTSSSSGVLAKPSSQGGLTTASSHPSIMKKRGYEQTNGLDGPASKRAAHGVIRQAGGQRPAPANLMVRNTVINHLNGRGGKQTGNRNRKRILSWVDAPADVYFVSTDATRKLRKQINSCEMKRAARKPCCVLTVKNATSGLAEPIVLD